MEMEAASCWNYDPDLWFSHLKSDIKLAVSICHTCPVQPECLKRTLKLPLGPLATGIWAGYDIEQLRYIKRKAKRK